MSLSFFTDVPRVCKIGSFMVWLFKEKLRHSPKRAWVLPPCDSKSSLLDHSLIYYDPEWEQMQRIVVESFIKCLLHSRLC